MSIENHTTLARELRTQLGYDKWENFNNLVLRAIGLIRSGSERGSIRPSTRRVRLGSGAVRSIVDYELDVQAVELISRMSSGLKLRKHKCPRNETAILTLMQKYCQFKGFEFSFQYHLEGKIFDAKCDNVLIEIDEPHHHLSTRQRSEDSAKDQIALGRGYKMVRIGIMDDIVDLIQKVELARQQQRTS